MKNILLREGGFVEYPSRVLEQGAATFFGFEKGRQVLFSASELRGKYFYLVLRGGGKASYRFLKGGQVVFWD